jgi:NADH-quinone oxidoreductase subunit J
LSILILIAVPILAVLSLTLEKSISSLLSFGGMMFLLGVYYLSIELQLLGFLQIFVYTGGIAVLMLFGLSIVGEKTPFSKTNPFAIFFSVLFTVGLGYFILSNLPENGNSPISERELNSELLPVIGLIVVSLIYGSIRAISVSKESR